MDCEASELPGGFSKAQTWVRFSCLLLIAVIPISMQATQRPIGRGFLTRSEVIAAHGMACTSQPLATQAALDILKAGGSAVDAAIAADACLGLMEPTGAGVGGDVFALVWDPATHKLHGLNGSGRSPYDLTLAEFQRRGITTNIPAYGPLPVTVPGCVDGWFALHAKFGRMPMASNLAPAIRYATEGFPLSPVIASDWGRNARILEKYPNIKETYMPGGRPLRAGEVFKNPGLARTLTLIASGGRDAFYKGEVAHTIAAFMLEQGGFLSEKDLADHHSDWVEPISTQYRGYDVWELPPNGQGLAVLQMLNVMEGFDVKASPFGSAEAMHLFIEAKKLAFEDRAKFYADPDFYANPIEKLLSKDYAAERRKLIRLDRAALKYDPGLPQLRQGDTVYLTFADSSGMMVSFIQSNYRGMGSGMAPPGLGFILHDRGELFDLTPGRPNTYAPHKRPFHTIIPAFVTKDGEPWLSFGVMGGDMQPQGHVQVLVNLIDYGMSLQEAGDAPRIYHTKSSEPTGETMIDGGVVNLEAGFPEESIRDLLKMGHKISYTSIGAFGGYQAIQWDRTNHVYIGASESRKDGQAAGY
jgi:gamma-glutamyltranspeptidase/glutathione hydrolase